MVEVLRHAYSKRNADAKSRREIQSAIVETLQKLFTWKWSSVVLLGICLNFVINLFLDFKYQRPPVSFSLEEYVNAIIGASFLLGGSRVISRLLDKKLPWSTGVRRRLFIQSACQLLYIFLALNILLIGVTYMLYNGEFTSPDLLLINICTVTSVFFFASADTAIALYRHSKSQRITSVSVISSETTIAVTLGVTTHLIKPVDVCCAYHQAGVVVIRTNQGRNFVYDQSLSELMNLLPSRDFFRANRQYIIHRGIIQNHKSADYGKIEVVIHHSTDEARTLVISRTKASAFRKWLATD